MEKFILLTTTCMVAATVLLSIKKQQVTRLTKTEKESKKGSNARVMLVYFFNKITIKPAKIFGAGVTADWRISMDAAPAGTEWSDSSFEQAPDGYPGRQKSWRLYIKYCELLI